MSNGNIAPDMTWTMKSWLVQLPGSWKMAYGKKTHYDWVVFHPPLKKHQPWGFVVHERFFFLSFAVSMPDRCSPSCLLHRKMRRGDWLTGWSKKTVNKMFVRSFLCCPGVSGAIDQGLGRFVLVPHEWTVLTQKTITALAILLTFGENYTSPPKFNEWLPKMMGWKNAAPFTNGNIWYSC